MKKFVEYVIVVLIFLLYGCQNPKFEGKATQDENRWSFEINYNEIIRFKYALKDYEILSAKRDSLKMGEVFFQTPDDKLFSVGIVTITNDTASGMIFDSSFEKILNLSAYELSKEDFYNDAYYTVKLFTIPDIFSKKLIGEKSFRINKMDS